MDLAKENESLRRLIPAPDVIAAAWHDAIATIAYIPIGASKTLNLLAEQSANLISLLLSDPLDAVQAKEIGKSLALLHLIHPEVLAKTQDVLTENICRELTGEQLILIQSRLIKLMGHLAVGFVSESRDIILLEQEEIRNAQIKANRGLEEAIRQSEEKYRTLVESAKQAIFIVDRNGAFQFMNGSAAQQLGGTPQDYVGRTVWDVFPRTIAEGHMASIRKALDTGKPVLNESTTILQGKYHWRETSLQPLRNRNGCFAVLGVSVDITRRKHAEVESQRYLNRLKMLHEIDRGILAADSPATVAQAALQHVQTLMPSREAGVILLEAETEEFVMLAGKIGRFAPGRSYTFAMWPFIDQIKADEPLLIADISSLSAKLRAWDEQDVMTDAALLAVPLMARGTFIGSFILISDQAGAFTEERAEVARQIGASLSIAIHDARLLEAERIARHEHAKLLEQVRDYAHMLEQRVSERTKELSTLYEVTAIANTYFDLETILDLSISRAAEALQCRRGTAYLVDESGKALELVVTLGIDADDPDHSIWLELSKQLANEVLKRGIPVSDKIESVQLGADGEEAGSCRCLGVPMKARGKIRGVFSVSRSPSRDFSEDEISMLVSVADHLAVAVSNAQLHQNAERVAVMEERHRLARELHDSVTQELYSLTLFAEAAQEGIRDSKMGRVRKRLDDIESTALQALKEMRLMLFELRTAALDQGLVEALRQRVAAVEARAGISTHLEADELPEMDVRIEEDLYRIAQEALNNTLKHTTATEINLCIRFKDGALVMEASDNGQGFDPDMVCNEGGMGLDNMRERTERSGGELSIMSQPGVGTRVIVKIPVDTIFDSAGLR